MLTTIQDHTDEEGASAVEYGLLVAGIAGLVVAIVFLFGGVIGNLFDSTCAEVDNRASISSVSVNCS